MDAPPPPLPPPLPLPLPPPIPQAEGEKKPKFKTPQRQLTEFWDEFHHKAPGKVTTILPRSLYESLIRSHHSTNDPIVRNAATSYEVAAEACKAKVASIVKHCEMTNEKFTDPDFDVYKDPFDCLHSLMTLYPDWEDYSSDSDDEGDDQFFSGKKEVNKDAKSDEKKKEAIVKKREAIAKKEGAVTKKEENTKVANNRAASMPVERQKGYRSGEMIFYGSVHRVDWIFEKPQFTVDGFSASDIRQGRLGNCWWLAAVATIAHRQDLMDKVMVARNEECGVYGFVFHRDGEWIYTVIDDNLFLTHGDFTSYGDRYDPTGKLAREHKKNKQTGSRALILASCEDENETWLPLLEKAYAKVHNDFTSLSGGWPGEGVEDMTGGVNSYLITSRILSRDRLWKELVNEKGEFVFSLGLSPTGWESSRGGMATGHAYSLLKAVEVEGPKGEKIRLVQIRNPWGVRDSTGFGEWNGPWSDGSGEWTPYWMEKLNYKFGDDGLFWMTYEDMLAHYDELNRTRLFNSEWTVAQQWTSVNVSWVTGYLQKRFVVEVKNGGLCVIVLSQLDERYWTGLEGEYMFELYFLLITAGGKEEDVISRARCNTQWDSRSISCEIYLDSGKYEVLPKVIAIKRWGGREVVKVVQKMTEVNPEKLRQVGMQYDIAHARPGVLDEDEALEKEKAEKKKKEDEKKKKEKARKKEIREKEKARKAKDKILRLKEKERKKRRIERANTKRAKRRVRREQRLEARAKAKAKKEVKKEKQRLKKEEAKAKAEVEAAAATAIKKESPPASEKDAVIVKKEDAEEEVKAQTQREATIDSAESKTQEAELEKEEAATAVDVPVTTEEQKEEKGAKDEKEEEEESELGEESSKKGKTDMDENDKKVDSEEDAAKSEDEDSSSDEYNEDLNYTTEPEVSSDEEYVSSDEELEFDSDSESETEEIVFEETIPTGWNPVVVIGLRCYSKDKDVMVTVVEPKDPKENAAAALAAEKSATGSTGGAPL